MMQTAAAMFDPLTILLVVGGSLVAAALGGTRDDLKRAVAALGPLVRASPARDERAALCALVQVEQLTESGGLACADRVDDRSAFVREAALRLVDAESAETFSAWGRNEIEARRRRHESGISFWRSAADTAPGIGMIGTVFGLAAMLGAMDDPARMGAAMALAMLTTLYGLVLANLVLGPMAERLSRLSEREIGWQTQALARLDGLARGQPVIVVEWQKRTPKAMR